MLQTSKQRDSLTTSISMEPSVIFLVMLFVVTTISAAGTSSRTSQDRTCTPFEGNSDLYGFGIRLGVYLQWISSWITNTLNPKSAAPNHDTNSIWVLAVVCAGAAAIAGDDIRPIEVYIMLLICYGYFMTVLNMFGFRIRLLSPVHLPKLMKTLEEAFRACSRFSHQTLASWSDRFDIFLKELSLEQPVLAYLKFFWNPAIDTVTVPLKAASSMKHDSFSWGGVAWRVAIASAVYSSSIWYWFGNWRSARASANEEDCNTQVFLFGLRSLESHTVTFFRTVTIAMAIPMLWLAVLSIGILTKIWVLSFFYMLISAQANHAEYFSASRWYRFLSLKSGSVGNMLGVDYQHNDREHATLSLVQAWLSLSSALPSQPEDKLSMKFVKESPGLSSLLLILHVLQATTIACFISFIELTIAENNITGVYTIATTGQLIPLIIGTVSFIGAMRELLPALVRSRVPKWESVSFLYDLGTQKIRIVRDNDLADDEAVSGLQDAAGRWH